MSQKLVKYSLTNPVFVYFNSLTLVIPQNILNLLTIYLENQANMKLFNTSAKLLGIIIASIFTGCHKSPKREMLVIQGNIMADTIWTADKNYVLDQQVTVPNGVTLTIEPGTVIKANAGEALMFQCLL